MDQFTVMSQNTVENQLKTNELGKLATRVQPWAEEHGTKLLAGLGVALVLAGITWWVMSARTQAQAVGWTRLAMARTAERSASPGQSVEEYSNVAQDFRGSAAGAWARLRECELLLETGVQNLFLNRDAATVDLKRARTGLEENLAPGSGANPECLAQSQFRLAQVIESTAAGDLTEAIAAYRKAISDYPTTIFKVSAEERIEDLERGATKSFYEWFALQAPKPPELKMPRDGAAGATSTGTTAPVDPLSLLNSASPATTAAPATTGDLGATATPSVTTEGAAVTSPPAATADPAATTTPEAPTEAAPTPVDPTAAAPAAPVEPTSSPVQP